MPTDLVHMIGPYTWIVSPVIETKVHVIHDRYDEERGYIPGKVKVLCGKTFTTYAATWHQTDADQLNHKICGQCYDLLRCNDASAAIQALRKLLPQHNTAIMQQLELVSHTIHRPTSIQHLDLN